MYFVYVKNEERWKKKDWKQKRKADKIEAMKEQWRNMRRDEKLKVELGTICEAARKEIKKSQENTFELMQDFSR